MAVRFRSVLSARAAASAISPWNRRIDSIPARCVARRARTCIAVPTAPAIDPMANSYARPLPTRASTRVTTTATPMPTDHPIIRVFDTW
jgi:hypothetical protein